MLPHEYDSKGGIFLKSNRFLLTLCTFLLLFTCISFTPKVYATYKSSYTEPTILIQSGCYGSGVRWVQDMLNHNGYSLKVDGVFGNNTLIAVKSFQNKYHLVVDGIVGSATRNALKIHATTTSENTNIPTKMYTTANLNLRAGASTSYRILLTIPKGSNLSVISKTNGWSYVCYQNTYGYVSSSYLSAQNPIINSNIQSNGLPIFSRNSSNLITIIQNCKAYYANNHFTYSTAPGVRSIPADKSTLENYYTDCSCYVSWSLYEYALANGNTAMKNYFSYQRSSSTFKSIGDNGGNDFLSIVSKKTTTSNVNLANAKPGDILVSAGHVEFFHSYTTNSNGSITMKVYNCGSTSSIQATGLTTSATQNKNDITYILRIK